MSDLDALLAGIVADAASDVPWLVLADWLEEFDDPRRAELARLHVQLRRTCAEPELHPDRVAWHARIVELLDAGVKPCVPQRTLMLPGNVEMRMAFIPPGSFRMGSDLGNENEKPVHRVTLTQGFWMGVYPVTREQWQAVMGTKPRNIKLANRPVESVDWERARSFCSYTSGLVDQVLQLPTEAQWEYACRAGTTTEYCNGDDEALATNMGWCSENSGRKTHAVGQLIPNAWGLYDCHGNVWEWCRDWWDSESYRRGDCTDPSGPQRGFMLVVRGGSWSCSVSAARSAQRVAYSPGYGGTAIGFRCIMSSR